MAKRAPLLCDQQAGHSGNFDIARAGLAVERLDVARGEFDRVECSAGERATRLLGKGCDRDAFGMGAVDADRLLDQRGPAARADIGDDFADGVQQRGVGAATRAGERGGARLRVAPVETIDHSIIFSIGMTRIAEAPAAFNRSSVSQNTDSWHTA